MVLRFKYLDLLKLVSILSVGFFLFACAPKVRIATTELDTPEHHTFTGMKFLNQGKNGEAQREFDLALQLNPKFSKAHAGAGLVKAYKADAKGAFDAMKQAEKYAETTDEKLFLHVGYIRLYTMLKPDNDWLKSALGEFEDAVKVDPKAASAYYFMGLAYKDALDFAKAEQMFKNVIDFKQDYVADADREWQLAQKIQRAMPGTSVGKKIAVLGKITRADAAALFMEELGIDKLYKKRTPTTFDTMFKTPEKAKTAPAAGDMIYTATDIIQHPLRADIEGVLGIGVRGLENYSDGSFHPNDYVDRATYAMMIEDILIKSTGDDALATKYIENPSPFPDLRSDLPYFNAVMVVTTRGIMEAKDMATGEFVAAAPVSGADALLVIRKIKEYLKIS
jgi:tetratricopeptide (TPR) repeat protein